ncbi:helix-turn-helix domain-containing protein [Castellaniella sp.]|uniref:helix-turn-helix domain-containing protein n=1 Tax=Castellaniella sp. TaxID=1955812 RepID=UPI002AFE2DF5|nr:helix-turn-helix domain-containing protein [Castellaniella sp.]
MSTSVIPVNALVRGLLVLETLNASGPAGLSDIWRKTGLPKATVFRMLETLHEHGYVTYDPSSQVYQVSLRALALSNNVSYGQQLLQIAAPVISSLREDLGWPSDLTVFQHDKMVIVDTNREPGMLSSNRSVGSRVPMMASATGRAYLANIGEKQQQALLKRLALSDDPYEQLAKDQAATSRIISETLSRGYALSDQEFLKSNRGAAAAIMHDGEVVCVINMIAIARIVKLEEVENRYVPLLLEAKKKIEALLSRFPSRQNNRSSVTRHMADGTVRSYQRG